MTHYEYYDGSVWCGRDMYGCKDTHKTQAMWRDLDADDNDPILNVDCPKCLEEMAEFGHRAFCHAVVLRLRAEGVVQ
jgi:hypothetical protein